MIASLFLIALGTSSANSPVVRTEYCASAVFRETPYADIRCARALDRESIGDRKHFEFRYDASGRLTDVRFQQNGSLRSFSDRFVRAPHTRISYAENSEVRHFYDAYGHRTLVAGNVYEERYVLDEHGQRTSLEFTGLDNEPVENDFGIARYVWQTLPDGDVIERRFDLDGALVRNRPGFGYFITRFSYDARGLLRRMTNLGETGERIVPDAAGVAMTEIRYDRNDHFIRWRNLDENGSPIRGMSDIAEIRYRPGDYAPEQEARFVDADGSPQSTRWGAHRVAYRFDEYGNAVSRRFFGENDEPIAAATGVHRIETRWSGDGAQYLGERYFDLAGNPVANGQTGVHEIRTRYRPGGGYTRSFHDENGAPVDHNDLHFAREHLVRDGSGRISLRHFEDAAGNPVDHGIWQVARFEFRFDSDGELVARGSYSSTGEPVEPRWRPAH